MPSVNQALHRWEHTYNTIRAHRSLAKKTPAEHLYRYHPWAAPKAQTCLLCLEPTHSLEWENVCLYNAFVGHGDDCSLSARPFLALRCYAEVAVRSKVDRRPRVPGSLPFRGLVKKLELANLGKPCQLRSLKSPKQPGSL